MEERKVEIIQAIYRGLSWIDKVTVGMITKEEIEKEVKVIVDALRKSYPEYDFKATVTRKFFSNKFFVKLEMVTK